MVVELLGCVCRSFGVDGMGILSYITRSWRPHIYAYFDLD